jgi:signal transduction protein with GAF and PtsI domain
MSHKIEGQRGPLLRQWICLEEDFLCQRKVETMTEIKTRRTHVTLAQENRILKEIVDIADSEIHLQVVLKKMITVIDELDKPDSIFIYLKDRKTKKVVLLASKLPHKNELGHINLKAGEGITGWVAQKAQTVTLPRKAYEDQRFKAINALPEDKYESFLAVPIMNKRNVIGVINCQHKAAHTYGKKTISLIELMAKQIGGVLVNAQLYDETKKKAMQFEQLIKVSETITSEKYLEEILNLIVVVTAEMLDSDICSIMLLDKEGDELIIKATQSLSEAYRKKPNLKVSASICGEVVRTQRPISVADVKQEARYRYRDLAKQEHLVSMLAVPMVIKGRTIGIITVYTKKPYAFNKEEINVLQMVANQAAVTIENTHLVQEAIDAQEALMTRKKIERAKGILMKMNHLSEQDAYSLIHKKSMNTRKSMKEIAESILLLNDMRKGR